MFQFKLTYLTTVAPQIISTDGSEKRISDLTLCTLFCTMPMNDNNAVQTVRKNRMLNSAKGFS